MPCQDKILFLYLSAFDGTGGIEKFNRAFMKALYEIAGKKAEVISCYDTLTDINYFPEENYSGFRAKRLLFAINAFLAAFHNQTIIISHINLAPIGCLLKLLFPRKKIILVVHGIEVWNIRSYVKKYFLKKTDVILSVSNFTRNKILANHPTIKAEKIKIFYNSLDPFLTIPNNFSKPSYLQQRYNIDSKSKVILTVARLSHTELYKGYDKIIEALPAILQTIPDALYLLCGKYTPREKERIEALAKQYKVENKILMPGFVATEELTDHYLLADVFVMPSKKEGFGIVFIEALACGTAVIAGNQDGSVEALLYGKLGRLVNPDDKNEIQQAIITQLINSHTDQLNLQQIILNHFSFVAFKEQLKKILFIKNEYKFDGATI